MTTSGTRRWERWDIWSLMLMLVIALGAEGNVSGAETLDVLIYQAATADEHEACLRTCNEQELIPGFRFIWKVVEYVSASELEGKDVVVYPGGTVKADETDIPALQAFVSAGGGYYGTCAGAGSAIRAFELTPQVKSEGTHFIGCVDVCMTEWGTRVFGYGGNVILKCYNGGSYCDPADVFAALGFWDNNHVDTLSRYGDGNLGKRHWKSKFDLSNSGEKYMQSYVDLYGDGWVVVVNAHPEIGKGRGYWFPKWVGAGVVWAAGHEDALKGYHLGFDRGLYDKSHKKLSKSSEHSMVCQREHVSASGTISSISLLTDGGAGDVVVGVYEGASRPEKCVAQSAATPARSAPGWQTVNLSASLRVEKGQTIWLCFMFQDEEQQYYYKRFRDLKGNTFENRVWASTCDWSDLGAGQLPHTPAGSTKDYLVCTFTEVRFDETDQTEYSHKVLRKETHHDRSNH